MTRTGEILNDPRNTENSGGPYDGVKRPYGSNEDLWAIFFMAHGIKEHAGFFAVQVCEAIEEVAAQLNVVPPTTSRDEPGDGESEAAFVERFERHTLYPWRDNEQLSAADIHRALVILRRAVATNAEPVAWEERTKLKDGWSQWYSRVSAPSADDIERFSDQYEFRPLYAHPPRDPEPEPNYLPCEFCGSPTDYCADGDDAGCCETRRARAVADVITL